MPAGRFDPDVAMQTIEREQVTAIGGVPTVMWRILESPNLEKYDLSSVKRASYGGAPAAPELVERIEQCVPEPAQDADDRVRAHRDRVGRDRARRRRLLRASRLGRARRADGRAARRGRRRTRRAGRGAGRDLDQGPHGHDARLLAPPRRERGRVHRRLVPHRRHRLPRRRRLPLPRRPGEGHDHPRRRERVLRRGRERAVRPPRRDRRRGRRRAAQDARRRGQGGRAAAARLDHDAPTTSARSAASTSPTSRSPSTSRSATSRCRATRRARC